MKRKRLRCLLAVLLNLALLSVGAPLYAEGDAKLAPRLHPQAAPTAQDEAASATEAEPDPVIEEELYDKEDALHNDEPRVHDPASAGDDLFGLSNEELLARMKADPQSIGSLTVGQGSAGRLVNGVQMKDGRNYTVINPKGAYGTEESIEQLIKAIDTVRQICPNIPKTAIGDLSREGGGRLRPHISHQGGRDVDVSLVYKTSQGKRYVAGSPENLDLGCNWAFIRTLVVFTDIEMILVDRRLQKIFSDYAISIGEDPEWVRTLFRVTNKGRGAIVLHAPRHRDHFHLRFYNARAQELGRRLYPLLSKLDKEPKAGENEPRYIEHRVKKGDTVGSLARRYKSTGKAILLANGLTPKSRLALGQTLNIPSGKGKGKSKAGAPLKVATGPIRVPGRKLPPYTPQTLASLDWGLPVREVAIARAEPTEKPGSAASEAAAAADDDGDDSTPVATKAAKGTKVAKGGLRQVNYTVRDGDNLWKIARRHKVRVADILRWNRLSDKNLRLKQRLVIFIAG